MKDDVQKENRGPPYLVLLFQTQEQFDHVAIDHNNRKKDETYIRLDLEFWIEVHLSEENRLQSMPCKQISNYPVEAFVVFGPHYEG